MKLKNLENAICIVCGKEFEKAVAPDIVSGGMKKRTFFRRSDCKTCCSNCSKIYNRIGNSLRTKYNSIIKSLKIELEQRS